MHDRGTHDRASANARFPPMSDVPFGFGVPGRPGGIPDDLAGKVPLFAELEKLLSWSGGPVNWDLARQLAITTVGG